MTISPQDIATLARDLHEAERSKVRIPQIAPRFPGMTMANGYAIQTAWLDIKRGEGRRTIGYKIGLTSRAMQANSSIDEPDYGSLLDDMLFAESSDVPVARFIKPLIEVELAFMLARPLKGPGVTLFDVLAATDYVTPALEIIDLRVDPVDPKTGKPMKALDTISDNAACGGVVLGGRPVKPDAVDLRWVGAMLYRNGVIEETGLAAGVLNHPATGIAWLANKLAPFDISLNSGDILLCGSFTRPVFANAGDVFHADYGALGGIGLRFV
ncbi:2-oxo-hepta-3-ene-1,7-dioic acid hydratase [Polymorphobacter arshaanensis]|uniref:2-oxo-hepta-3-ene-1,7-dioic acid hydratase n=1 Tax=Glacieibacterium arshaanense TaxID=2511025 RepID=A0A4Y9ER94_9SPHN|nr:2-oxo-hepta-3-ene-1,7-dioic acid hydratase [Polymorphobacter arshaanensis]TFU05850.1 2-oxo-hepta-3-ene-1,7-dioic acid hydratase [Polymorphobacter arshaanensis]